MVCFVASAVLHLAVAAGGAVRELRCSASLPAPSRRLPSPPVRLAHQAPRLRQPLGSAGLARERVRSSRSLHLPPPLRAGGGGRAGRVGCLPGPMSGSAPLLRTPGHEACTRGRPAPGGPVRRHPGAPLALPRHRVQLRPHPTRCRGGRRLPGAGAGRRPARRRPARRRLHRRRPRRRRRGQPPRRRAAPHLHPGGHGEWPHRLRPHAPRGAQRPRPHPRQRALHLPRRAPRRSQLRGARHPSAHRAPRSCAPWPAPPAPWPAPPSPR